MIPERGDIIHLQFDPSSGKEMRGWHYALVVSPAKLTRELGFTVIW
jgi:mRNA interferase ChpB